MCLRVDHGSFTSYVPGPYFSSILLLTEGRPGTEQGGTTGKREEWEGRQVEPYVVGPRRLVRRAPETTTTGPPVLVPGPRQGLPVPEVDVPRPEGPDPGTARVGVGRPGAQVLSRPRLEHIGISQTKTHRRNKSSPPVLLDSPTPTPQLQPKRTGRYAEGHPTVVGPLALTGNRVTQDVPNLDLINRKEDLGLA